MEHKTPEIIHKDLIGSPIHLKRLLMNILSNAVKNNKDYGKIYLSSREIPSDQDGVVMLEFICQDTGIGMSEEEILKLNYPFFTTKQNGTGLGVYLSREIIEKHNGSMKYESNHGVRVTIKLPYDPSLN